MPTVTDKNRVSDVKPGETVPAPASAVTGPSVVTAKGEPLARLGRYEAREELGRGGMGIVYRGHDPGLDRVVALKTLSATLAADAGFRARFSSEARALAKIEHPNVVRVYDVGEDGGTPYFAMELVEGRSADAMVRERGPLSLPEAVDLVKQAAAGLQAAHVHGIIHRDIKPSNLLLDAGGRVKVLDFGLAKQQGQGPQTATDVIMGTPEYMSPEQARGETPDHRSDIYALGATLYFLLAGNPPFTGESSLAIIHKQVNEPAPSIAVKRRDLPPGVSALLDRLLAKDPAARPATHAALIAELNALPLAAKPWPPNPLIWQVQAIVTPARPVEEALASPAADDPALAASHVLRVALIGAVVGLFVKGPFRAVTAFVGTWIALGLAALVTRAVARVTGHSSTLARHWCAEGAGAGHLVLVGLQHSPFKGFFGLLTLITCLRSKPAVLYQAGLTTFPVRVVMVVITFVLQMICLAPR